VGVVEWMVGLVLVELGVDHFFDHRIKLEGT
jgi:hypothetical protein